MYRAWLGTFVACAAVAAFITGCGSSSSSSVAATNSASPAATSSSTAAAAASGTPVKVLVAGFLNTPVGSVPELYAGAHVAADNINKAGGINGHPIQVVDCNTKVDPNGEVACARTGVSDGVIAGDSDVFAINPQGALTVLNNAHVADVAGAGGAPANATLPNTFQLEYIAGQVNGCLAKQALAAGGKIASINGDDPYSQGVLKGFEATVNANPEIKANYVGAVTMPTTASDIAPYVQKLVAKGATNIMMNQGPGVIPQIASALAATGKKFVLCGVGGTMGASLLQKVGPLSKELFVSSTLPDASYAARYPLVQQFISEMNAAKAAGNKSADLSINFLNSERAWMGMQVIADVAKTIKGPITAASFSEAMNKAKVDLGFANIDFAKPVGAPPYQRIFQPMGWVSSWDTSANQLKSVAEANLLGLQSGKG